MAPAVLRGRRGVVFAAAAVVGVVAVFSLASRGPPSPLSADGSRHGVATDEDAFNRAPSEDGTDTARVHAVRREALLGPTAAYIEAVASLARTAPEGPNSAGLPPAPSRDEFLRRAAAAREGPLVTDDDVVRDVTVVVGLKERNSNALSTLESIYALTPSNVRVIFVYSEPFADHLEDALKAFAASHSSLELHKFDVFLAGNTCMRQYGADIATTPFVAFVHTDTQPRRARWLHELLLAALLNPEYSVFVPFLFDIQKPNDFAVDPKGRHEANHWDLHATPVPNSPELFDEPPGTPPAVVLKIDWLSRQNTPSLEEPYYDSRGVAGFHIALMRREITAANAPGGPLFHPIGSEFFNHLCNGMTLLHMGLRALVVESSVASFVHNNVRVNVTDDVVTFAHYRGQEACESNWRFMREEWGYIHASRNCHRIADKFFENATPVIVPGTAVGRAELLLAWAQMIGYNRYDVMPLEPGVSVADSRASFGRGVVGRTVPEVAGGSVDFVAAVVSLEDACGGGGCFVRFKLDASAKAPLYADPKPFRRRAMAEGRLVPLRTDTGSSAPKLFPYYGEFASLKPIPMSRARESGATPIVNPPFAIAEVTIAHERDVAFNVDAPAWAPACLVVTTAVTSSQNRTSLWYHIRLDVTPESYAEAVAVFANATTGAGNAEQRARWRVTHCASANDGEFHGRPKGWDSACTVGVHVFGAAHAWHLVRFRWNPMSLSQFKAVLASWTAQQ